ncbi:lysylphosphatidylglycerol synthase-like protein [Jejuia pallidilutea]|uniref:Lysylphosphatidylglycerol synthase-like protein n=1 Tax=Jejuia pallidilutea TaxID=504487 RepID=A0A362XGW2_9FLAO|nr:lysylphosphatidylglycerol synthase domain-containing protein [Jejuia pallidilutea]PQV51552.1 lysylphosphatidylglycerol synthase-like protein [Jejuia pallidilutea]
MHYALPYKTKQFFFVLIKLSIVLGAGFFIYHKLVNNSDLDVSSFIQFTSQNSVFSLRNTVLLVVLSVLNWFLETLKWQHLASEIKKINFKNALEQSLGALTASLFTPNRIGEYGAKAMYYTAHLRKKIMLTNLLSNMLQMSITSIFGIIGFSVFLQKHNIGVNYNKISQFLIVVFCVVLVILLGFLQNRFKIKGCSTKQTRAFLFHFPKQKLYLGFLLSLARYIVFSFQFFLLLYFFKADFSYLEAITAITSMYLLVSIIPSIFIFDVVIKGSVAVYLFSFLQINELIVLSSITVMWLFNFVLPSIFGSYYVITFKLPKNI